MPIFGLNNGLIPIIAYNYGAKEPKRITHVIRLSIYIATGIMLVGFVLFQTIPATFMAMFDASDHMMEIGVPALRIISLSFLFAGYSIICSSVYQALGNGVYSLIVSAARQLFIILPAAYIFGKLFGLQIVWWAFPLAEIISVILCTILLRKIYLHTVKPLME